MNNKIKVALVTGASSGIGEATCQKFLENNFIVIGIALEEKANIVHNNFFYYQVNLIDEKLVEDLINVILVRFNKIDILINCAGITICKDLKNSSFEEFDMQIKVNLYSIFNTCKSCLKTLRDNRGVIINVGSDLGIRPIKERIAYCTSKAAVIMFTKCLALELAPYVRVNGINPGLVDTPMIKNRFEEANDPNELREFYNNLYPLKRMGLLKDMTEAIYFLATENSSFITGEFLNVCGGSLI